jgi:uncharacterized delta-60 repeat protein
MRKTFTLIALLVTFLFAQAQPGTLDPTFGDGGIVTTSISDEYNIGRGIAVQPDGKIVACGNAGPSSNYDLAVARYNTDGTLDASFGTDGTVLLATSAFKDFGYGVVIQDDGKIVVGGYIWNGSSSDVLVVRLNADGSLDNSFGTDGVVITDFGGSSEVAEAIALQDDGKLLLAGYYNDKFMVLRYNTDGTLDNTYGSGGMATANVGVSVCYIQNVVLQDDGKLVAVGMGFNEVSYYAFAVARFNTDGSLDNTFADNGTKLLNVGDGNDFGSDVDIQSDGKIIVGGHSWIANQPLLQYDFAAVRLNENGSIDETFGESGIAKTNLAFGGNYVSGVAVQADDKIILSGRYDDEANYNLGILRYTANGVLDTSFGTDGITITNVAGDPDYAEAVVLQDDGKILTAGYTYTGGFAKFLLVRYNSEESSNDPSVEIATGEITTTSVEATFTPVNGCATYYALIGVQSEMEMWSVMMGVSIDSLVQMWGIEQTEAFTQLWTGQIPNTEYTLYARPLDANGVAFPLSTVLATTLAGGGNGLAEIEVQVTEIADSSARLTATPNDQTAVFFDGLITAEYFNQIGEDSAVSVMRNNGYPQYETDDWVWLGLTPNTDYYAIATGKNALDEWGPATIVAFSTLPTVGINDPEELQAAIHIYPMPNNGAFTFAAPNNEAGTIRIFNAKGQIVLEQMVSGQQNAIDARSLSNGLYHLQFTSKNKKLTLTEKLIISQ